MTAPEEEPTKSKAEVAKIEYFMMTSSDYLSRPEGSLIPSGGKQQICDWQSLYIHIQIPDLGV